MGKLENFLLGFTRENRKLFKFLMDLSRSLMIIILIGLPDLRHKKEDILLSFYFKKNKKFGCQILRTSSSPKK
jgi:hypothetical protein